MFYVIYIFAPIVFLALFSHFSPKHALLSVPICILLDLGLFWNDFVYYESRPLAIMFTVIQAVIVTVSALAVKENDND